MLSGGARSHAPGVLHFEKLLGKQGRMGYPRGSHFKAELKRAEKTYDDLAWLKKHGFEETKTSVASKLACAAMSAHFFLASLVAIDRQEVTLEDI